MIYDALTGELLVSFDTYIENTYDNANGIAFEPLENGSFSSDSKQNTPELIGVTGIKSIGNPKTTSVTVGQVKQSLIELNQSARIVFIILQPMINNSSSKNSQWYQYGIIHKNVSLFRLNWENNPEQLELRAVMTFQQIRLTNTEYTQQQAVANPQDTPPTNAGQVQPSQDASILNKAIGKVPL